MIVEPERPAPSATGGTMRRRDFIATIGGAAAWPLAARAQQPRIPRVGYLLPGSLGATWEAHRLASFRQGLRDIGFVEGRNVLIDVASADGQYDRFPAMAAEFVRRAVDVMVVNTTVALSAAKAATGSIPIVFQIASDPVEAGFVAALNRPGGNLTGFYNLNIAVTAKRLELLHEAVPAATSIAYFGNPSNPILTQAEKNELQIAARILGLRLIALDVGKTQEFEGAFAMLVREGAGALVIGGDVLYKDHPDELIGLAARHAVPAIYDTREFTAAGGLMSYGTDNPDVFRQTGIYAGRILKGDKPADLPVQQVTKMELVINMKTANALGITFPLPILGRADAAVE